MKGRIFNIDRYAIHDGKGIRTQVFFKGCPLHCLWCSNPEGISAKGELMYSVKLCIGCGYCIEACKSNVLTMGEQGLIIDRNKCLVCGDCEKACYAEALELTVKEASVEEILEEVQKDDLFFEVSGGGGMTLCGGESLAQPDFAKALLSEAKQRGINTTIETCGCCDFSSWEKVIPYLDFIYYDIKHMDAEQHKKITGQRNELILNNLKKLQEYDINICVRIPVIPGLNDDECNIEATAAFVKGLKKVKWVELLPYHQLGVNKYEKLGRQYSLKDIATPDRSKMRNLVAIFEKHGVKCCIQ